MHWFGLWAYHDTPFDRVVDSLAVVLPTLVIALACFVWVPDVAASGSFDVEVHYFGTVGWVLPLIAIFSLSSSIIDLIVPGVAFRPPSIVFLVPVAFLGLLLTRRRAIHIAVFSVLWVANLAVLFGEVLA